MIESAVTFFRYIDLQLFFIINYLPHTPLLDTVAMSVSGIGAGGIIFIAIAFVLFMREQKKDHAFLTSVIIAVMTAWMLSEKMFKPFFGRMRPYGGDGWADAIVVDTAVSGYSFPSSHATFAWAVAVLVAVKDPKLAVWCFMGALVISLSRVYLGVHYPSDVAFGTLLGIGIGIAVRIFIVRVSNIKVPRRSDTHRNR